MAQFDVHRNTGRQKTAIPYVVTVQSRRFDDSRRRVVVPLVLESEVAATEPALNPAFEIEDSVVLLHPIQIVSVAAELLGAHVCSLKNEGDRIIGAIDLLLSRAWD